MQDRWQTAQPLTHPLGLRDHQVRASLGERQLTGPPVEGEQSPQGTSVLSRHLGGSSGQHTAGRTARRSLLASSISSTSQRGHGRSAGGQTRLGRRRLLQPGLRFGHNSGLDATPSRPPSADTQTPCAEHFRLEQGRGERRMPHLPPVSPKRVARDRNSIRAPSGPHTQQQSVHPWQGREVTSSSGIIFPNMSPDPRALALPFLNGVWAGRSSPPLMLAPDSC